MLTPTARPLARGAEAATLAGWLGVPARTIVVLALVVIVLMLWSLPPASRAKRRWPWPVTGTVLGMIGALTWTVTRPGGPAWGLSLVPPRRAVETAGAWPLAWSAMIALGVFIGAWVSARREGRVVWRMRAAGELRRRLLGGVLMGAGGAIGAACTIGQALTGLSMLSLSAVVATGAILVGGKVTAAISDPRTSHSRAPFRIDARAD